MVPFIRIFGDKQAQLRFNRGAAKARDMRSALSKVADDMMRVIRMTFYSQGRRYGGSWTFLKPDTIKQKARKHQDPRILIANEKLMNSFTKRRSRNQILRITADSIELDSKLSYAATHQFGDEGRGIPARPFIAFDPRDERRWAKICEDELLKAMGFR